LQDLVDFLKVSDIRVAAAERLARAFEKLDALNFPAMNPQKVQAEIDAARVERRLAMRIVVS